MGSRRLRTRPTPARPRWRPRLEVLETRRVLSAVPLGAVSDDTAEYLLGRVAVTPVFFESNGLVDTETQDWTELEKAGVLQKIGEGMDWWVSALEGRNTVHSLEFVYDTTYADDPVETFYEPIDRTSEGYSLYVGNWLTDLGYADEGTLEGAIRAFNHDQRIALDADWSFTIVVVDASDGNGEFAPGGFFQQAFAFAGGMFMVVPSSRPASTFAHEMGHIFYARDEYAGGGSWHDLRGYYNTQNLNAVSDNPDPNFQQQPSIMSSGEVLKTAYNAFSSPASTFAFVGWQDSDGDGIFDVLDVPLHLEGSGHYDAASGSYQFNGFATAVPLENANPWGLQNDVTLNRISRIEYSIDGGPFVTAVSPDRQQTELSFTVTPPADFSSIRFRAIDAARGVTSPIIAGTANQPAFREATVAGYAFLDANANGVRDPGEALLEGLQATLTGYEGSATLPGGTLKASDQPVGPLADPLAGVTLTADGATLDGRVGIAREALPTSRNLLAYYDLRLNRWDPAWSGGNVLTASFDDPTTEVRVEVVGIDPESIGRMEAYDADGNYLFRANTPVLQAGETASLQLADQAGQIASVRIFGQARSEVALTQFAFGPQHQTQTDAHGTLRLDNLPDGTFEVTLQPQLVIHQPSLPDWQDGTGEVTVGGNAAGDWSIPVRRVDSPFMNVAQPADVDQNGAIQPLDALQVINDLNRDGSRILGGSPGISRVDVNNDGYVTPLDALSVINALNRQLRGGEGESLQAASPAITSNETHASGAVSLPSPSFALLGSTAASEPPPLSAEGEGLSGERPAGLPSPGATDTFFRDLAAEQETPPKSSPPVANGPPATSLAVGMLEKVGREKIGPRPFFGEPFRR